MENASLVDVLIWIGKREETISEAMREALVANDDGRALEQARELLAFDDLVRTAPEKDLLKWARSEQAQPVAPVASEHKPIMQFDNLATGRTHYIFRDGRDRRTEIQLKMNDPSPAEVRGLTNALTEIGEKRQQERDAMKAALERGDSAEAVKYARKLVGLEA